MITKDRTVTIDHDLVVGHTIAVVVRALSEDGRVQAIELAPQKTIELTGVVRAPQAPAGLTATAFFYSIYVTWTNPTDADFDVTEVWRNTVDSRATAVKIAEMRTDSFMDVIGAAGVTEYYWVRSRNTSGIVSAWNALPGVGATTETVGATDIDDFAITATKMFTNTVILTGDVWTDNSPSPNYVAWNAHTVVHNGASYAISAGNTTQQYVYWVAGANAYSTATSHPSLGSTKFMIAYNRSGVAELVWNSSANMVIGTAWIMDAAITNAKIGALAVDTANIANLAVAEGKIANLAVAEGKIANLAVTEGKIANLAVTNAKIADLAVDKLTAGTITSKSINLAVAAGTGDAEIRAGIATGDFANAGAASGFIIGIDDSDSDKAKLYIGDSTHFLNWTGATLVVQGLLQTAASGRRAELNNSDNSFRLYTTAGSIRVLIDDGLSGYILTMLGNSMESTAFDVAGNLNFDDSSTDRIIQLGTDIGGDSGLLIDKDNCFVTLRNTAGTKYSTMNAGAAAGALFDTTGAYKVNNIQVVGARVIDARCDDTINSGDATTDGVIDALRDAMIAHGLIAAA